MINLKKKIVAYSPSDLRKMPFRPTKYAHPTYESAYPTYEKCPSDLRKMLIRPTKSSHPTYGKCPSDLQILPIRPTKRVVGQTCPSDSFIVGRMHQYAVFKVPIRPTVHWTNSSCRLEPRASRSDGLYNEWVRSKNTPS